MKISKKLLIIGSILLCIITLILTSCNSVDARTTSERFNISDTITKELPRYIVILNIDNCEYISFDTFYIPSPSIIHKVNCSNPIHNIKKK